MSITSRIIKHVYDTNFENIPETVINIQKKALMDAVAVSLAASSKGEGCSEFIELARELGGDKACVVIGCGFKASLIGASLANGSMAHAMDYEDAHDLSCMHSNAVSTAAAITIADHIGGVSGKEFLAAMTLGSDITIRLALALNEDSLMKGWYMPPIHGAMGASLAVGKIMKFNETQLSDAFTLTMNQVTCSGELVNSSGSVLRSVRDSFAAKSVVLSCLLAEKGLKAGFETPLEGKLGYYHGYAHDDYTPLRITEQLGEVYESSKISFKPWPSCRGTHPYIDLVIDLIEENNINVNEIEKIHTVVSSLNGTLFKPEKVKYRPNTAINAKFSIPFTTSLAAHYGTVKLEHFTDEYFTDKRILSLMDKIFYEVNEEWTRDETLYGRMTITLGGKEYFKEVHSPKGSIHNPMNENEFEKKFFNCAGYARKGYSDAEAKELYELLNNIEDVNDMREVTRLL